MDNILFSSLLNTTFTFFDSNCLIGEYFNFKEKYPFCLFYVSDDFSSFLIISENEEYILDIREKSYLNLSYEEIEELKKEAETNLINVSDFFYTGYKKKEYISVNKEHIYQVERA